MSDRFSRADSALRFVDAPPRVVRQIAAVFCVLAVIVLAGCAPSASPPSPATGPLPEVVARFDAPPLTLVTALERLCTTPAQRITRPAAGVVECRMLLSPEATAGAILRYDGTIERLPESVVRLRLSEDAGGYLLASAAYLEVPRAAGDVLRVVFPDPDMDRRMARVLANLGGTLQ